MKYLMTGMAVLLCFALAACNPQSAGTSTETTTPPHVTVPDTTEPETTLPETTVADTTPSETTPPTPEKMVLDAMPDALYGKQGFTYEADGLYIFAFLDELKQVDEYGSAIHWETEGSISFAFDGEALWFYMEVYDPTFFGPDTEYIMNTDNPWQTNSIELWYCFDGEDLLHVDVDAYGTRLFTDSVSLSKHFNEIEYAVETDAENCMYYAEIRIPAKTEDGTALQSGDPLWYAFQINDLRKSPEEDPSRCTMLATSGGHYIENFTYVTLP